MSRRIIRCKGHSILNDNATDKVPWADVWVSWVTEQRGKREYYGPTLIGAYDLRGELRLERELAAEHPKDRSFAAQARRYARVLEAFRNGKRFEIEHHRKNKGYPTLYTSEEFIDRGEAERMLAYFLKRKGIDDPVFRWEGTDIIVGQVSFGAVAETAETQNV
jgi:hypothetical protein